MLSFLLTVNYLIFLVVLALVKVMEVALDPIKDHGLTQRLWRYDPVRCYLAPFKCFSKSDSTPVNLLFIWLIELDVVTYNGNLIFFHSFVLKRMKRERERVEHMSQSIPITHHQLLNYKFILVLAFLGKKS